MTRQPSSGVSTIPDTAFPRSEVIQNLSVLISSIEYTVRPTSGNYAILTKAKKSLQAILNTVLAPAPPPPDVHSSSQLSRVGNNIPASLENSQSMDIASMENPKAYIQDPGSQMGTEGSHSQQQQSQSQSQSQSQNNANPGLDNDMHVWLDEMNFDMDFWSNLEDHPMLAWPEGT